MEESGAHVRLGRKIRGAIEPDPNKTAYLTKSIISKDQNLLFYLNMDFILWIVSVSKTDSLV